MILELALAAALARPAAADQPPECVSIVVQADQSSGATVKLHMSFCGFGAGADSALHDYVNHDRSFVLDGGGVIGHDCGTWSAPCVIFGP